MNASLRKKIGRLLAAVVLATGVGAFAISSPAMADVCQELEGRGYGCMEDALHWAYVCDTNADNWGVRIHVLNDGGTWNTASDGNGKKDGCGGRHVTGGPGDDYYIAIQTCTGENGADTWCSDIWYWQ